ncbi:hypothetical protein EB052_00120 [bacterium]|nr:hypothetical protein [bacterium]
MFNIDSFFQKFKSRELDEIRRRSAVASVIKRVANIDVDIMKIKFETGRVVLSIGSLERNEIFMKKSLILQELKKELDPLVITEIR